MHKSCSNKNISYGLFPVRVWMIGWPLKRGVKGIDGRLNEDMSIATSLCWWVAIHYNGVTMTTYTYLSWRGLYDSLSVSRQLKLYEIVTYDLCTHPTNTILTFISVLLLHDFVIYMEWKQRYCEDATILENSLNWSYSLF